MAALIIIGGGGHASVLAETARAMGLSVAGYTAPQQSERDFAPYLGDDALLETMPGVDDALLVIGFGSVSPTLQRENVFYRLSSRGFSFATLVHPGAIVASSVKLGAGTQVLAGCVIQSNVVIDVNVILNTGSTVDHDSRIAAHAHIAPRAVLCGGVVVGKRAHVGAGAIIVQNATVPDDGFVRAGAVVNHAGH